MRNRVQYFSNYDMSISYYLQNAEDTISKYHTGWRPDDINDVIEEVGDVLWYLSNFCNINKITLEECMYNNSMKLKKRYPNGFTVEDALARVDKEQ